MTACNILLTVASALLVSIAFPPVDAGALAWIGLVPFFLALRRSGLRAGPFLGFLFGGAHWVGGYFWALKISTVGLSVFLLVLLYFALFYLVFGLLYPVVSRRGGLVSLAGVPALWVSLEYLRSNMFFLSFPWNLLGHSQYRSLAVIQIADVTGVYGISFLLVLVNEFLSRAGEFLPWIWRPMRDGDSWQKTRRTSPRPRVCSPLVVLAVLTLVFSYGWNRLSLPEGNRRLRVAILQANSVVRDTMTIDERMHHLLESVRMTKEAARRGPDLIVWPASSLPMALSALPVQFTIFPLVKETGAYLLVGGAGREKDSVKKTGEMPYANTEILISPVGRTGRIEGEYHKVHLLPFNEYLPLERWIRWPGWITGLKRSFSAGPEMTLFRVAGARFGAPICWENMFPDFFRHFVANGADFMVSVTNEAFFGKSPAPYQTLAMNAFRAVENRVSIARCASTGISAFIRPSGEIVDTVRDQSGKEMDVPGILVRDIPLAGSRTFYTRYGDLFARLMVVAAVGAIWIGNRARKKGFEPGEAGRV